MFYTRISKEEKEEYIKSKKPWDLWSKTVDVLKKSFDKKDSIDTVEIYYLEGHYKFGGYFKTEKEASLAYKNRIEFYQEAIDRRRNLKNLKHLTFGYGDETVKEVMSLDISDEMKYVILSLQDHYINNYIFPLQYKKISVPVGIIKELL